MIGFVVVVAVGAESETRMIRGRKGRQGDFEAGSEMRRTRRNVTRTMKRTLSACGATQRRLLNAAERHEPRKEYSIPRG